MITVSGIRGNAKTEITPDFVQKVGLTLLKLFPSGKIVLGYDPRPSSEKLYQTLHSIFGKRSLPIGIASTPSCQHAVRTFGASIGVMITASHNPASDNGIKIFTRTGRIINPEQAQLIKRTLTDMESTLPTSHMIVEDSHDQMITSYHDFLIKTAGKGQIPSIVSVIVDANGGGGIVGKGVLESIGVQVDWLGDEPGFYHREIEPTKESLQGLLPHLATGDYHLAAAFDGDADRVELISGSGQHVSGQQLLAIILDYALTIHPGRQKIVLNEVTSGMCTEIVEKHGCKVREEQVGEFNVVSAMEEEKSPIGGESSGAIIAPSQCRDGWLSLLFVLCAMKHFDKDLDELLETLPNYTTLSEKIKITKPLIMENVAFYLANEKKLRIRNRTETSVKAVLPKAWISIRSSNTESGVVRLMTDAQTPEQAEELLRIAHEAVDVA